MTSFFSRISIVLIFIKLYFLVSKRRFFCVLFLLKLPRVYRKDEFFFRFFCATYKLFFLSIKSNLSISQGLDTSFFYLIISFFFWFDKKSNEKFREKNCWNFIIVVFFKYLFLCCCYEKDKHLETVLVTFSFLWGNKWIWI